MPWDGFMSPKMKRQKIHSKSIPSPISYQFNPRRENDNWFIAYRFGILIRIVLMYMSISTRVLQSVFKSIHIIRQRAIMTCFGGVLLVCNFLFGVYARTYSQSRH